MLGPVLQLDPGPIPDWAVAILQGMNLIGAVIGVFIAYQAYRGYKRNESKPMLYIAVGFFLVLGVPLVLFAVAVLIPATPQTVFAFVSQSATLVGLLAILYAIRMQP